MKKKYTKKDAFRDLGRSYKDINDAYLKFMRPWNKTIENATADDFMYIVQLEIMKNAIEGVMECWCCAMKSIYLKEAK